MNKNILQNLSIIFLAIAIFFVGIVYLIKPISQALAGVSIANSYNATSTAASLSPFPTIAVLSNNPCEVGDFTVNEAGAAGGHLDLYDATTTNVLARTGQKATSTILIASFPSNLAAGTYTLNASCKHGLLLWKNGTYTATSTIHYR